MTTRMKAKTLEKTRTQPIRNVCLNDRKNKPDTTMAIIAPPKDEEPVIKTANGTVWLGRLRSQNRVVSLKSASQTTDSARSTATKESPSRRSNENATPDSKLSDPRK